MLQRNSQIIYISFIDNHLLSKCFLNITDRRGGYEIGMLLFKQVQDC